MPLHVAPAHAPAPVPGVRSSGRKRWGVFAWPQYGASHQFQSLTPPTPTTGTGAGFTGSHKCAIWGS
jgi:hypothetical protein